MPYPFLSWPWAASSFTEQFVNQFVILPFWETVTVAVR